MTSPSTGSSTGTSTRTPRDGALRNGAAAVTMYSTQWCGYCHRLKSQLDREGIAYDVVDIERVPDAAFVVEQVNGGNQTVPTLVYSDGSAQTNPSVAEVKAKLAALA
jgi:mycoredoxin